MQNARVVECRSAVDRVRLVRVARLTVRLHVLEFEMPTAAAQGGR